MPQSQPAERFSAPPRLAHTPQPDEPPPGEPDEPSGPPIGDPPPEPDELPHSESVRPLIAWLSCMEQIARPHPAAANDFM